MLSLYKEMLRLPGRKVKSIFQIIHYEELKSIYNSFNQKCQMKEEIFRLLLPCVFVVCKCESSIGVIEGCFPENKGWESLKLFSV